MDLKQNLIHQKIKLVQKYRRSKNPSTNINDENFFFIMGSGRNGSTLVARLLNNHTDIFLPPEQYALPKSIKNWYQKLNPPNWEKYIQQTLEEYIKANQNWKLNSDDKEKIFNKLKRIAPENQSSKTIYHTIYQYYAEISGVTPTLLGDHAPYNTQFYKYIYSEFPNAKFIFLIRHPLDVILSYSKIKNHPGENYEYSVRKWNESINALEYFQNKGAQVLTLTYENLVSNPKKIGDEILNFLELPLQDLQKIPDKAIDPLGASDLELHQKLYQKIDTSSIGKWKKELDTKTLKKVKPLVLKNSKKFNYEF